MPEQVLDVLNEIMTFFLSAGSAGGLIGAFLILAASYFTDVGLRIKSASWIQKIMFLFAGALAGALFHHTQEVDMLYCSMLGAGWPYVAVSFTKAATTLKKANALRRIGGAALKEAIRIVQDKVEDEEGPGHVPGS